MRFGVWYDDGRVRFGWLGQEGGNGRVCRWESDEEAAREQAAREQGRDSRCVYQAVPIGGDASDRFNEVRLKALEMRVDVATRELAAAKTSLDAHAGMMARRSRAGT